MVFATSYSVSYGAGAGAGAGAVALVLSRAPMLSGAQAAELALSGAVSGPFRGPPEVTGRGRLDLGRTMRLLEKERSADRGAGNAAVSS